MNPDKFVSRGLHPIESHPVRVVDFERRFWGKYGMAEVREKPGAEFHAVIHLMSEEDMVVLDQIERGYIRKDVVCYKYDGTRLVGSAYQFDLSKLMYNGYTPPSARYRKLMYEGMAYYGCDPIAVEEMRRTPTLG